MLCKRARSNHTNTPDTLTLYPSNTLPVNARSAHLARISSVSRLGWVRTLGLTKRTGLWELLRGVFPRLRRLRQQRAFSRPGRSKGNFCLTAQRHWQSARRFVGIHGRSAPGMCCCCREQLPAALCAFHGAGSMRMRLRLRRAFGQLAKAPGYSPYVPRPITLAQLSTFE